MKSEHVDSTYIVTELLFEDLGNNISRQGNFVTTSNIDGVADFLLEAHTSQTS